MPTEQERFMSKIIKTKTCWIWKASFREGGYGQFRFRGTTARANRVSYILFVGDIPKGKFVLHTCDNTKCVNPEHLFIGDHFDNMKDMFKKGRNPNLKGDKHPRSKLKPNDILAIRRDNRTYREIAKTYGIDGSHVSDIKNFKTWKHI